MNIYKILVPALAAVVLWGCDDDLDRPPVILPEATIHPNSTILEVKTKYWQSDKNYAAEIGLTDNDEHVIISGRVISNGQSGNVYKSLIIQDETAALSFSINNSKLYETYAIGQEVVVDLTALNIGKYNGLQQVGQPQAYQQGYEVSFMDLDLFQEHAQFNELPEPSKVQTLSVTIPELMAATTPDKLCQWQSQLIKLDSVRWEEAGQLFTEANKSTNRYLVDAQGNKMLVRNSNYATFATDTLPYGTGSVVAIASYYGNDWQLLLRSADDLIGFDKNSGSGQNPNTPENPDQPNTPDLPTGDAQFKATSTLTADAYYVFAIGNQVGTPIGESYSYGRLALKDATFNGDVVTTATTNAILVKAVAGGYVLIDTYGRYLSMDSSHLTSFQLYDKQEAGSVWTWQDGYFANQLNPTCKIGQDMGTEGTRYTNIAPSASDGLVYPSLYVLTK